VRHHLRERPAAVRALAAAIAIAVPALAHANGAFPDAQSILTPVDRPAQILLVTNFGVIMSADAGATWLWSCETEGNAFGMLYQLAPLPSMRLFTVADQGLSFSDNGTCTWVTARGALDGQSITDAYVDPDVAGRVLAIGIASSIYSVYESKVGGMSFAPALFTAPASHTINTRRALFALRPRRQQRGVQFTSCIDSDGNRNFHHQILDNTGYSSMDAAITWISAVAFPSAPASPSIDAEGNSWLNAPMWMARITDRITARERSIRIDRITARFAEAGLCRGGDRYDRSLGDRGDLQGRQIRSLHHRSQARRRHRGELRSHRRRSCARARIAELET
jgi:hypothetical protein